MRYRVVSVKKGNHSAKQIVTYIACGIVSITAIVTSISPPIVRANTKDAFPTEEVSEFDNYNVENASFKTYIGPMTEPVVIPEAEVEEEPIIQIIEEEPVYHELTNEEKLQVILTKHNITEFEFWQIVSTLAHEAGAYNYKECYDVICTLYNRTLSSKWCWSCKQFGGGEGTSIINQLRLSGQFAGFLPNEAGYDKDKFINTAAYQAAIDFLYTCERSHNYLSFNAPWYEGCPIDAVQLNPECKGNKYFGLLELEDLNEKAIENDVNLGVSR